MIIKLITIKTLLIGSIPKLLWFQFLLLIWASIMQFDFYEIIKRGDQHVGFSVWKRNFSNVAPSSIPTQGRAANTQTWASCHPVQLMRETVGLETVQRPFSTSFIALLAFPSAPGRLLPSVPGSAFAEHTCDNGVKSILLQKEVDLQCFKKVVIFQNILTLSYPCHTRNESQWVENFIPVTKSLYNHQLCQFSTWKPRRWGA